MRTIFYSMIAALLLATNATAGDWPQFRGPGGEGHTAAKGLPLTWSETENIAWKTPTPGRGWSSPVIEGNEIWMTAAIEQPLSAEEKQKRLKAAGGNQPLTVSGDLSLRAICVDLTSGKLLAEVELMTEKDPQPTHSLNSFASPTPVIEAGRLYCHFGAYGTACLDTKTRKVVWTNREMRINHENGPGSSVVLWKDTVIFTCDGSDVQYTIALDKATGKTAWKTDRSGPLRSDKQLKKSYGTPLIVPVDGRPQLISPGADWLYAYDPDTGKELWKVGYGVLGFSISPRPVVGHGMIYMCTSFMQSELLAIRYDGQGTEKQPHVAWRYKKQAPQIPSPLLVGDEIYIVSDKGVATCLDAKTGDVHWTQRLPGQFCASPLLADGRIYFCSREGETTVIEPGKQYKKLALNKLDARIMASLAAVDGAFLLRTEDAIYRIQTMGK